MLRRVTNIVECVWDPPKAMHFWKIPRRSENNFWSVWATQILGYLDEIGLRRGFQALTTASDKTLKRLLSTVLRSPSSVLCAGCNRHEITKLKFWENFHGYASQTKQIWFLKAFSANLIGKNRSNVQKKWQIVFFTVLLSIIWFRPLICLILRMRITTIHDRIISTICWLRGITFKLKTFEGRILELVFAPLSSACSIVSHSFRLGTLAPHPGKSFSGNLFTLTMWIGGGWSRRCWVPWNWASNE